MDYAGAVTAAAADKVQKHVESLARLAVVRGNALLVPLMEQIMAGQVMAGNVDNSSRAVFKEALDMFKLALRLEPENATARNATQQMQQFFDFLPPIASDPFDVIIVGAGCAGVGMALML